MSEVKDNPAASRLEMASGDAVAFVEYTRAGDRIVLTRTEVPEASSGQASVPSWCAARWTPSAVVE